MRRLILCAVVVLCGVGQANASIFATRGFTLFSIDATTAEVTEIGQTNLVNGDQVELRTLTASSTNVIPEPSNILIWSLLATLGFSFRRRRRRRAF